MRTSIKTLGMLLGAFGILAPTAAFADDDADEHPAVQRPRVVTTPVNQENPEAGAYVVPHEVPYMGGAIPANAHIETKPNGSLIGAGLGVWGGTYLISLIYALSTCGAQMDCRQGSAALYIPVIGPFITAAQAPTSGGMALAAFDGSVQVLGAALAVAGFIAPKKFVVWQDHVAKLSVTPIAVGQGMSAGVGVTLTHM